MIFHTSISRWYFLASKKYVVVIWVFWLNSMFLVKLAIFDYVVRTKSTHKGEGRGEDLNYVIYACLNRMFLVDLNRDYFLGILRGHICFNSANANFRIKVVLISWNCWENRISNANSKQISGLGPIVLHTHHQVKALGCPYKTFTTATDLMCRVQPEP